MRNVPVTIVDAVTYEVVPITVREYMDTHNHRRFMEDLKDIPHVANENLAYLASLNPRKKIYMVERCTQERRTSRRGSSHE